MSAESIPKGNGICSIAADEGSGHMELLTEKGTAASIWLRSVTAPSHQNTRIICERNFYTEQTYDQFKILPTVLQGNTAMARAGVLEIRLWRFFIAAKNDKES